MTPLWLIATFPLFTLAIASIPNTDVIISSLSNFHRQIQRTSDVFSQYDGSLYTTLPLTKELYNVMLASRKARQSFDSSAIIPFEDVADVLVEYHQVRASLADGLALVGEKMDVLDSTGARFVAVTLLRRFSVERMAAERASKAKIPWENHTMIPGPVESVEGEIQRALSFFL